MIYITVTMWLQNRLNWINATAFFKNKLKTSQNRISETGTEQPTKCNVKLKEAQESKLRN